MSKFFAGLAITLTVVCSGCGSSTPESGPGPGPQGELRTFESGAASTDAKPLEKPK